MGTRIRKTCESNGRKVAPAGRRTAIAIALALVLVLPTFLNTCQAASTSRLPAERLASVTAGSIRLAPSSPAMRLLPLVPSYLSSAPVTIEEDWELNIGSPDAQIGAPQVGTVMTPFDNVSDLFMTFMVNHRFNPSNATGGLEMQVWSGGKQLGWVSFGENLLQTSSERVTWTQRLRVNEGQLRFRILNGQSQTWGSFGGSGDDDASLRVSIPTDLLDLGTYRSAVSVQNSGVTFASNRVVSLILNRVRGYGPSGTLAFEETTPVVVFSSQ